MTTQITKSKETMHVVQHSSYIVLHYIEAVGSEHTNQENSLILEANAHAQNNKFLFGKLAI